MADEPIRLVAFADLTGPQIRQVTDIFSGEFDAPWEWPVARFEQLGSAGASERYWAHAAVRDDEAVAFAVAAYLPGSNLWYLLYLAVDPAARGQGTGSWMLGRVVSAGDRMAVAQGRSGCAATLLEVERPDGPPPDADAVKRERRIRFYRRHAAISAGTCYPRPPTAVPEMPDWDLMLIPGRAWPGIPDRAARRAIVKSLMFEGYQVAPDTPWLLRHLEAMA